MKQIALFFIRSYKFVFQGSPARCRFYPSCSTYVYLAIENYGVVKGCFLGLKRVLRCHPFCKGGYDPLLLPKEKN